MALIKYSALVTDMRGKLNGSVAAKNRGGQYLRNKTTPVNPQSIAQQKARATFGGVSSLFRQLKDEDVNAWNAAAQNFPYTNIFGDVVYLNGLQLFTKLNTNLTIAEASNITMPPSPMGAGSVVLGDVVIDISEEEAVLDIDSGVGDFSVMFVLEATAPQSGNTRFYKNHFRTIAVGNSVAMGTPSQVYAAYVDRFGTPPDGGNIAFRLSQINTTTGERSVGSVVKATVQA